MSHQDVKCCDRHDPNWAHSEVIELSVPHSPLEHYRLRLPSQLFWRLSHGILTPKCRVSDFGKYVVTYAEDLAIDMEATGSGFRLDSGWSWALESDKDGLYLHRYE